MKDGSHVKQYLYLYKIARHKYITIAKYLAPLHLIFHKLHWMEQYVTTCQHWIGATTFNVSHWNLTLNGQSLVKLHYHSNPYRHAQIKQMLMEFKSNFEDKDLYGTKDNLAKQNWQGYHIWLLVCHDSLVYNSGGFSFVYNLNLVSCHICLALG